MKSRQRGQQEVRVSLGNFTGVLFLDETSPVGLYPLCFGIMLDEPVDRLRDVILADGDEMLPRVQSRKIVEV